MIVQDRFLRKTIQDFPARSHGKSATKIPRGNAHKRLERPAEITGITEPRTLVDGKDIKPVKCKEDDGLPDTDKIQVVDDGDTRVFFEDRAEVVSAVMQFVC